jgi:hypothetical protein
VLFCESGDQLAADLAVGADDEDAFHSSFPKPVISYS